MTPSYARIYKNGLTNADEATAYYRGAMQALVGFKVEKGSVEPVKFSTKDDYISQCGVEDYVWSMRAFYRANRTEAQLFLRPCMVYYVGSWSLRTASSGSSGGGSHEDFVCSYFDIPVGEYREARERCVDKITAEIAEDWKKRSEKLLSEMRCASDVDCGADRTPEGTPEPSGRP
jgi:hypothetical protein